MTLELLPAILSPFVPFSEEVFRGGCPMGPLVALGVLFAFLAGTAAIVKWLWNQTCPEIFGWKAIDFWASMRLVVLAKILLGGGGLVVIRVVTGG